MFNSRSSLNPFLGAAILIVLSTKLIAREAYNPNQAYLGGSQVIYDGKVYEAQWWANIGDSPANITNNSWESPWIYIEDVDLQTTASTSQKPATFDKPSIEKGAVAGLASYEVLRSTLRKKEQQLTDFALMKVVKETIRTRSNSVVEQIAASRANNPENVKRVEKFVSQMAWDKDLFPKRAPQYSYRNFLQAVGKFPAFCATYNDGRDSDFICRKALATMFAHFVQETGGHNADWNIPKWQQGLVHLRELGWTEQGRGGYNGECEQKELWQQKKWPCGTFTNGDFKSYFGRGAKQLSYNFNYGPFSEAIYRDVNVLLKQPELVADTWLNLASAIYFFLYPKPPKPSMLHVIDGTWKPNEKDKVGGLMPGFGVTTLIVNGGVECGGSVEIAQSVNRASYYKSFANYFNVEVPANEVLGCKGMKAFESDGAGAINIYWVEDWSWKPNTPGEKSYACQLVGYQTAFSAFVAGDYANCVQDYFPNTLIIEDE